MNSFMAYHTIRFPWIPRILRSMHAVAPPGSHGRTIIFPWESRPDNLSRLPLGIAKILEHISLYVHPPTQNGNSPVPLRCNFTPDPGRQRTLFAPHSPRRRSRTAKDNDSISALNCAAIAPARDAVPLTCLAFCEKSASH